MKKTKKLAFSREIVRTLTTHELDDIAGGGYEVDRCTARISGCNVYTNGTCPSEVCNDPKASTDCENI